MSNEKISFEMLLDEGNLIICCKGQSGELCQVGWSTK